MKIQLLVTESCDPCEQAEQVWRSVAREHDLDFSVVDLTEAEGRRLANLLQLKTIPALVVDGALVAIGVQSPEEARVLVARSTQKRL